MEVHSIDMRPTQVVPGNKRKNHCSYLDYYKTVLQKVSFDGNLFYKEYRKAINSLSAEEAALLKDWVKSNEVTSMATLLV